MSGETEREVSGWTVDTLKEYVMGLRQADQRALEAALVANEKRLDALNELRQGVATSAQIDALEKTVDDLKDRLNRMDGKSTGLNAGWAIFLGGLGAISIIIGIILAFSS